MISTSGHLIPKFPEVRFHRTRIFNIHLGCKYGILTSFINMGAIFMTAFFVLSGYVIYYTYQKKDLGKLVNIKLFYKKRYITILPIYYLVGTLYIIFFWGGTESLQENVILMPIEILGLQSVFTSIFSVSHNGGTWFVSCILLCYLIYPFAQEIIKQISLKSKIKMLLLSVLVLLWSPFIVWKFQTGARDIGA